MRIVSTVLALTFVTSVFAAEPAPRTTPLPPAEAQKLFKLTEGLRIELVASEPQIESPVAMAFDEQGRLWVVEMRDYPNGPKPGEKPGGRIKILEDKDGDGFYETSHVFADGLLYANGITPWKGGVIVTMAPKIVYLKEVDGQVKTETLYEGFAAQNPQLRVSHPVLGPDGWVYVANGLRGGKVIKASPGAAAPGGADKPLDLSGRDFRFNLITGQYEALSGPGQYGNCFDDWGRRFVCDNRHHLRHVVIEDRYLKRNPYLAAPAVLEDISELDREEGPLSSGGRVYPISKNWTTSALHVGRFTAACGVHIYRGDLLPAEFKGCAFTCEPTGNLVHQEILTPKGATFTSTPAEAGVEFLATTDDWFRPVFLHGGPDGALYVIDMCRAVIEHPEFMPPELKNRPDLLLGRDKGRIWRLVPDKYAGKTKKPNLGTATLEELVKLLNHPNFWYRTTAQRLLLERQDKKAIQLLRELVEGKPTPEGRYHAALLLRSFDAVDESLIEGLRKDDHPRLRELAALLAENRPAALDSRKWFQLDSDARARFQLALTVGNADNSFASIILSSIAEMDAGDHWTRLAIASSASKHASSILLSILVPQFTKPGERPAPKLTPGLVELVKELFTLVGARHDIGEVVGLLLMLRKLRDDDATRWQAIEGLAEGLGRRGLQLGTYLAPLQGSTAEQAREMLDKAAARAADEKAKSEDRLPAVRLLAHVSWGKAEPILAKLLASEADQALRLAAARALAGHSRPEVAALLLKSWSSYSPALRREVIEAVMRQPERIAVLLGEIEARHIKPAELDAQRVKQLTSHSKPEIRDRARKLLAAEMPAERKLVMEKYQAALAKKGEPKKGQAVFQKNCATCHHLAGTGVNVGPSIADTERTKTASQLLLDILNPNAAIDSNYFNYEVTLKNGRVLTGLIAAETASSLTLKRAENQTDTVLRQDIEELRSTGVSLMPEGLEKNINVDDMADLIAFLKNWRYLDGAAPVGKGAESKP
jgi:putative membrane-bound dehydrogenase-like protein